MAAASATSVQTQQNIGLADMLNHKGLPDAANLVVAEAKLLAVGVGGAAAVGRSGGSAVDTTVLHFGVFGRFGAEVLKAVGA